MNKLIALSLNLLTKQPALVTRSFAIQSSHFDYKSSINLSNLYPKSNLDPLSIVSSLSTNQVKIWIANHFSINYSIFLLFFILKISQKVKIHLMESFRSVIIFSFFFFYFSCIFFILMILL